MLNGLIEPYFEYINELTKTYDFHAAVIATEISGVSNARNLGLSRAQGKYVCFIDDDDKISPTYLEDLYSKASTNNIVASNVKAFYDNSDKLENDYISVAYEKHFQKKAPLSVLEGRKFMSSSCCKIISKEIIKDIRFDTNLKLVKTLFSWQKSAKMSKALYCRTAVLYITED